MKTFVLLLVGTVLTVVGLASIIKTADRLGQGRYSEEAVRLSLGRYTHEDLLVRVWWASIVTYAIGSACMVLGLMSYVVQMARYLARGDSNESND